jgi:hypothetical protein
MAKRDDYEKSFRTIEQSLGSSSNRNPAGAALEREDERKARAKKAREKARLAKGT